MKIKDNSISLVGVTPQVFFALNIIEDVMRYHKNEKYYDLIITSGSEASARHSVTSLHYSGNAVDVRCRDFTASEKVKIRYSVNDRLGIDFDFILENDHFHLEYQPKRRE